MRANDIDFRNFRSETAAIIAIIAENIKIALLCKKYGVRLLSLRFYAKEIYVILLKLIRQVIGILYDLCK